MRIPKWIKNTTLIERMVIIALIVITGFIIADIIDRDQGGQAPTESVAKEYPVFSKLPISEQAKKLAGKNMSYAYAMGWVNTSDPISGLQANFGTAPDGSDCVFITCTIDGKILWVIRDFRDRDPSLPSH